MFIISLAVGKVFDDSGNNKFSYDTTSHQGAFSLFLSVFFCVFQEAHEEKH